MRRMLALSLITLSSLAYAAWVPGAGKISAVTFALGPGSRVGRYQMLNLDSTAPSGGNSIWSNLSAYGLEIASPEISYDPDVAIYVDQRQSYPYVRIDFPTTTQNHLTHPMLESCEHMAEIAIQSPQKFLLRVAFTQGALTSLIQADGGQESALEREGESPGGRISGYTQLVCELEAR